jgi:pyruvate dehydrogenase E2 component (dihydrolipoamide acetyltransferase)
MPRSFKLPDLGEGIHEGEVLNVLVAAGDTVKEGDSILEVETDKAAAEIPSPFTGKVAEIKVKPGDMVQVGDVLMTFTDTESEEEPPPEKEAAPPEEKTDEPQAVEEKKEEKPPKREKGTPVPASPATRRLARELDVDLRAVNPSGPGGRVTADDVRQFAEGGKKERPEEEAGPSEEKPQARPIEEKAPELPDFSRWGAVERVPVRSIRRATAKQMALAWSQIPHVYNQDMVDMTQLEAFRRKHKQEVEEKGGKLSITVFALKAAATALKENPRFNASMDTKSGEMVLKHYYHIGVAVNTEEGLVVPVIRDVDRKSILELSMELKDLVQRTRERKVKLEEMQGGTFTITNVGPMGGGYFAPLINFPEVAILGMGAARMQPTVIEDDEGEYGIVPHLKMPVVLSIDHRILDGADALRFMATFIESMEDPEEMFITMT